MRLLLTAAVLLVPVLAPAAYSLKQVCELPTGSHQLGHVVLGDADRDGLPDFNLRRTDSDGVYTWSFYEALAMNSYFLVKSETCVGEPYPPPGLHKGTFFPSDIGDIDGDGLVEILGVNTEYFGGAAGPQDYDSLHHCLCLYESPDPVRLPDTLVWSYNNGQEAWAARAWLSGDMDRDGHKEAVYYDANGYTRIFENRGDNENEQVWVSEFQRCGYDYAFGDFDGDSLTEFAYAQSSWLGYVYVFECTGDDQYELVDSIPQGYPNGSDVFSGDDLDRDGRPEFYVVYMAYVPGGQNFYVKMYEAEGNNRYRGILVDSICSTGSSSARHSLCCDIDLDGVQELLVSFNSGMKVYRATGNDTFEVVHTWRNWESPTREAHIKCYDMNRNGYPDIVISGGTKTWFLEMEAVKVLAPGFGDTLAAGDTCRIRWQTLSPPRCDSVSLFFLSDTVVPPGEWFWRVDTIATGLAPTESSYAWVVPDTVLAPAWVVAIAYGPGWQHDRSDSSFAIVPAGIAEEPPAGNAQPVLPTLVGRMLVLPGREPADLLDVTGRRVLALLPGRNDVAALAPGVYFVLTPSPQPSGTAGPGAAPSEGEGAAGRARAEGSIVRRVVVLK